MFNISDNSAFKPYTKSNYPTIQNLTHQNSLSFVLRMDGPQNQKLFDFSRKDSYLNNDEALYENPFNQDVLGACEIEAQLESPMDSS